MLNIVVCLAFLIVNKNVESFKLSHSNPWLLNLHKNSATSIKISSPDASETNPAKVMTKEIMSHFNDNRVDQKKELSLRKKLFDADGRGELDGMHMMTLLFQSARSRRKVKSLVPVPVILKSLNAWDREWSERDISTFVYGVRALECIDTTDADLLKLGAKKIKESSATLSSRAIGNALYGLQDITSDTAGAAELCAALALKIEAFEGELNGQDIGIGMYGLQGMSSDVSEVRALVKALAAKIKSSDFELDAQAMGNTLYGLQSMSSAHPEVLALVSAIATKVSESRPALGAQAIGSALYGLQRLGCEALEVRTLVAALAEKVELSTEAMDAQAIGNALFGLQSMSSMYPEVRSLAAAIANKVVSLEVSMDSKGIGSALYGLNKMTAEPPQVRALLAALAASIEQSGCILTGQGVADALYGLSGMSYDCPELRALLKALSNRIDGEKGKLDAQEIGNALYGLSGLSSEMPEVRLIVSKLVGKISRSKAILRTQHIGRALLGLQRFTADSTEVRLLLRQLVARISESDRTRMTSQAIGDALYGLQGMSSDVNEVQELLGELAKKIAATGAVLTPRDIGRALFGLQGLSSSQSLFAESAIGLDSDEVQFVLSALWDKIKVTTGPIPLQTVALGLQGLVNLRDPIADNIRQFLYVRSIGMKNVTICDPEDECLLVDRPADEAPQFALKADVITAVRAMRLNNLLIPKWLALAYNEIESVHTARPVIALSKGDKQIAARFTSMYPQILMKMNALVDGFRLDMNFPDVKLNIELDGVSHAYPGRARFDRLRDEFLRERKDYEVIRVPRLGQETVEIVKFIHQKYTERQDKMAELAIQKLYAKDGDAEIQKLYSKDQ